MDRTEVSILGVTLFEDWGGGGGGVVFLAHRLTTQCTPILEED